MANIEPRKNKDGKITSYRIRVSRGRGYKPYETSWKVPKNWSNNKARKEVEKFAAEFEVECRKGLVATEKKTFKEYADYVLSLKETNGLIKPRTLKRYKELLERINDEKIKGFGWMLLTDIRATDLNEFYKELSKPGTNKHDKEKKSGLSPKTIKEHHRVASMIFGQALKEGLVPFDVSDRATPPKIPKHESEHYEIPLIKEILSLLNEEDLKWQVIVNLLIASGCRLGEVCGLQWDCVDFENSRILVKRNLQYQSGKGLYVTTPKSGEQRYVALPESVMDLLMQWKEFQRGVNGHPFCKGFLFTQKDGKSPMYPDSVGCFLNRFSKRHNLPHLHPHAFRHSQASLLIDAGEDITSVSKRLGYASVTTTLNIYSHILENADKKSASAIDNLLYKEG